MSERRLPASLEASPLVAHWLGFDADGEVRVRSGRVELGQGNATALLQIAADELDVRPDQVSFVAGDTRETPNEGFTSGSLSIQVGGQALRLAASAARHLLLAEAATLLQTAPDRLTVRDGAVFVEGRETDLDYWKLAQRVPLAVPVAAHARPKAPAERTLAGRSLPRTDLAAKLSGGAFIHDLALPGMLHGRVLHPPAFAGRLAAFDEVPVAAMPGVRHIVRNGSFVGVIAEREDEAVRAIEKAERLAACCSSLVRKAEGMCLNARQPNG
jgi:CO/xanthine dehydrogenase Mo-binding subunit